MPSAKGASSHEGDFATMPAGDRFVNLLDVVPVGIEPTFYQLKYFLMY
jgi:hypothetical protein